MILELADIRIPPGKQAEFDAAIIKGVETVASKAKGFRGYKVNKGIESPGALRADDFLGHAEKSHGGFSRLGSVCRMACHCWAVFRGSAEG